MPTLLSVVMPTYNGEAWLAPALESLLPQLDGETELVVVDDGSSDGTVALVERLTRGTPTRLLRPGRLGNWVAATNAGLREARGEWACFLHQDDLWSRGRMARLREELPGARGNLLVHDTDFIGPAGEPLGRWTCPFLARDVAPSAFIERLLVQNWVSINAGTFRRAAALAGGGLDERLWFSADWDLWLRMAAGGPVRVLRESLGAYRIHPESQTSARKIVAGEWEDQLGTVLERHLASWPVGGARRRAVERTARASIAVNAALAVAGRGGGLRWGRFLRDSRIVQRLLPRLRLRWRPGRRPAGKG
jgi:glycosyltransferase involved in cell wall biosynthesis